MALLQIGGGPKEKCAGVVAGIDLGTTYSLVSVVEDGTPKILKDEQGRATLRSLVWYGQDGSIQVGKAGSSGGTTITSSKRFMGRSQSEAQKQNEISPYDFASDVDGQVVRFTISQDRQVTPVEVGAEILRVLKKRAEAHTAAALDGVVITVPAYFDDAQRQATKDAARLADLTVLRLLNEPTAAALAYGLDKKKEGLFAVFDMGGGTFDISLLRLEAGVFQVLTTGGDSRLGGDDFDQAVAEYYVREQGQDPAKLEATVAATLLQNARLAKEQLTNSSEVTIDILDKSYDLTKDKFEEIITPVLKRALGPIRKVLKDADIEGEELDGVVLVGGSTRVPAVRDFVARVFGQEPLSNLDPDQVVALGAAVQADLLGGTGPRDDVLLLDVLPLSLGIETMGGVVEKILHRNQTIPVKAAQEFTTYADGQTAMDIHVLQGEREMVGDCRSLGRFKLRGIPPRGAGMSKVQVTFAVDADGILDVSAMETETGVEASVEVKPSYGLTDEEVERMILDSFQYAQSDVEQRVVAEANVEAERILSAVDKALQTDGSLLEASERAKINEAIADLKAAVNAKDANLIKNKVEALDRTSASFAAQRMNRSINQALSGVKAETI